MREKVLTLNKQIAFRGTKPLARALRRAAYLTDESVSSYILKAVIKALQELHDYEIDTKHLAEHEYLVEDAAQTEERDTDG